MSNEIVRYTPDNLKSVTDIATMFAASSYFTDAGDKAKAFTKILAGMELGIPPIASMKDIYIVKGKVSLSAMLIASLIKKSKKYNFKVKTHTEEVCVIEFLELLVDKYEVIGTSSFSIEDAKKAGLTSNDTWKKYPRNMLWARAISNGARWYTPDIFSGAVYTPDELDPNVQQDEEGNVIVKEKVNLNKVNLLKPSEEIKVEVPKEEIIEAEIVIKEDTVDSLIVEIDNLFQITNTDKAAWLQKAKISSLKALDLQSLTGLRNNLQIKFNNNKG